MISLLSCDGAVRGVALVDDADLERLSAFRWFLNSNGYAARAIGDGRAELMHREIMGLGHGDGQFVDHVNQNKLDNRRENLRVVDALASAQNRPSCRGSSSRFRGVSWAKDKRRWRVRPQLGGASVHVGYFASEIEAAKAAETWRKANMPFAEPDPLLA